MSTIFACKQENNSIQNSKENNKVNNYHTFERKADQFSGGIQMIPVETASGTFKVWTKRVGNNPKIKVLLLHGGPGCTHELFHCFDGYLPAEGIEYIYYDQLGSFYSDIMMNQFCPFSEFLAQSQTT